MIRAYVSGRAKKRRTANDLVRHAVDQMSHLSGATDSLCGSRPTILLGAWDPDDPRNCKACTRHLEEEANAMDHEHEPFPELPQDPPEALRMLGPWTCPAVLPDGSVCGGSMILAHSVRALHFVRSWSPERIVLSPAVSYADAEDDEAHLWCSAGHDWAVPAKVEFE